MTAAALALALAACYPATVLEAHDGDTLTAVLRVTVEAADLELRATVEATERVRVADLRAPELSQRGGLEARDVLVGLLAAGAVEVCPRVTRSGRAVRTFGRLVADVLVGGVDVATAMVAAGVAGRGSAVGWEAP